MPTRMTPGRYPHPHPDEIWAHTPDETRAHRTGRARVSRTAKERLRS